MQEIINGCINNDRKYQEILYKTYYTKFKNVVRKIIKNEHNIEEILNNGFLRIFKKIHMYEEGNFDGWMLRIIKNSIYDYLKKYKNYDRVDLFGIYDDSTDKQHTRSFGEICENNISDTTYYDKLLRLVDELPPCTKKVFDLHIFGEYKHIEIAEILGITTSTSKWHLSRARELLREKINKLGLLAA